MPLRYTFILGQPDSAVFMRLVQMPAYYLTGMAGIDLPPAGTFKCSLAGILTPIVHTYA